ncbi:MAG: chemotaxis protein CheW [Alcanivoracaceae bacterium]|nr:chemotaxis protein CheW [Alcanivoracaceae bacterium]
MELDINPSRSNKAFSQDILSGVQTSRCAFTIMNYNILQDSSLPCQFSKLDEFYELPHSSFWFCGLINQHNTLVPVYDLARLFDIQKSLQLKRKEQYVLTIELHGSVVGLLIDDMPQLIIGEIKLTKQEETKVPEMIESSYLGLYRCKNKNWLELSFHKLFLNRQFQNLFQMNVLSPSVVVS